MGMALTYLGGAVCLVGLIWLLVVAFQESVLWGVLCLCVPFAAIVYAVTRWDKAGKPCLVYIAGIVLNVLGYAIGG